MAVGGVAEVVLDEASHFAAIGLDPFKLLYATDTLEIGMLRELYRRTFHLRETQDLNLAKAIAAEVSRIFG